MKIAHARSGKNLNHKLVIIFGPTASGKTSLSLTIARHLRNRLGIGSEIISTDSRQLYREMDIGTGKVDDAARKEFPHHFIDILSPQDSLSSDQFGQQARLLIDEIHRRGNLPLIVGGTGTLVMSVVGDQFLKRPRRPAERRYNSLFLIPHFSRKSLYSRIERNVDQMLAAGLYDEVKKLVAKYGETGQLVKTIGYKEFFDYTRRHQKDLTELSTADLGKIAWRIKRNSKRYAMHQIGWLKKLRGWQLVKDPQEAKDLVTEFLLSEVSRESNIAKARRKNDGG